MANTAINHDPAATFPGSSTDTAVVKWSGTGGKTIVNSGVLVDASNNVTGLNNVTATGYLHLTGDEKELRFYEGANYIAIKTNASLAANYTFTLPLNDGSADEFLQTNGSGVLTWAAAAGTTINSNADNRVITGSGTANTLNGETNLTYDGSELTVGGTGAKLVLDQSSGDAYLLELRSSDVAHALSGYNTATYGHFMKKHATSGMLQIWGFSDADANQAIGLSLVGVSGIAADTTKTTSAIGIVEILAGIKNGTAIADPGSNGNILVIRDAASGSAKMIVDQEGDVRVNEGSAMPSVTKGAAKAWVQVPANGSMTTSSANSYNVASVTDNTTGDRSVVVDVDFTNTTYCALSSAGDYANLSLRTADYAVGSWNFKVYDGSTLIDKLCASAAFGSH